MNDEGIENRGRLRETMTELAMFAVKVIIACAAVAAVMWLLGIHPIECGACGAHVWDWTFCLNYNRNEWIPICFDCAQYCD